MARSMAEILSRDPGRQESREVVERPETGEPEAKAVVESKPDTETKPEREPGEAKPDKPAVQAKVDDEDEQLVPDDLEGLKRALAAARGDKRKARKAWRETEQQLAELRGRLDATKQAQIQAQQPEAKEPEKPKAPVLDEEAFYAQGPAAVQSYLDARLAQEREAWQAQAARQRHLDMSEARAMARHDDYAARFAVFQQAAPPHVVQQMLQDQDPAEYVYEWARAYEEFKDTPSIDALREKLREELRAEMAATQPAATHDAPRPQPTKSLASARGTGAHAKQTWSGPRPLSEILAR